MLDPGREYVVATMRVAEWRADNENWIAIYCVPAQLHINTMSVKINITLVQHSLKNPISIIFVDFWTQISYRPTTHYETNLKAKCCVCQTGDNAVKSRKRQLKKYITETAHRALPRKAAYCERSIAIHSISMAGYVTAAGFLSAA